MAKELSITANFELVSLLDGDLEQREIETLVLLFHGYGENAAKMLERLPDLAQRSGHLVLSLEAPHRIYLPTGKTACSWLTSERRELSIRNNLSLLSSALELLRARYDWKTLNLVGYSQGAQMAMRAAAEQVVDHLVVVGAELPPELRDSEAWAEVLLRERGSPWNVPHKVSLLGAKKDMAYRHETKQRDAKLYRSFGAQVQTQEWAGGHAWSDRASGAVVDALWGKGDWQDDGAVDARGKA